MPQLPSFEFLDHPADIKIRAYGKTLPELFINAAKGITFYLFGEHTLNQINTISEYIDVSGIDRYSLFVNFLSEVLYLSVSNKAACVEINIYAYEEDQRIRAEIILEEAIAIHEIKAVTYSELEIKHTRKDWQAVFVCDI